MSASFQGQGLDLIPLLHLLPLVSCRLGFVAFLFNNGVLALHTKHTNKNSKSPDGLISLQMSALMD